MAERGISEQQVVETVNRPDYVLDSETNGSGISVFKKQFGGRDLEVIVKSLGRHKKIITAYWL